MRFVCGIDAANVLSMRSLTFALTFVVIVPFVVRLRADLGPPMTSQLRARLAVVLRVRVGHFRSVCIPGNEMTMSQKWDGHGGKQGRCQTVLSDRNSLIANRI
jgi:hypothetical protein